MPDDPMPAWSLNTWMKILVFLGSVAWFVFTIGGWKTHVDNSITNLTRAVDKLTITVDEFSERLEEESVEAAVTAAGRDAVTVQAPPPRITYPEDSRTVARPNP